MNPPLILAINRSFLIVFLILLNAVIISSCRVSKPTTIVQRECDSLYYDLETGMINSVSPLLSQIEIKEWFTCFTRSTADGAPKDCGGGVFYDDHGFYYNTYMDYVEVNKFFKGTVTANINFLTRKEVRETLKDSLFIDNTLTYPSIDFFVKPYGCLTIKYERDKVSNIASHFNDCSVVIICENK